MGRSREGHGTCSGCVPIMQVFSYCVCRTVLKVRCICLHCILLSALSLGLGILFHTLVSFPLSFSGKKCMQQKRTLILIVSEWLKMSRNAALYDYIQTRGKRETDVHNWDFERKLWSVWMDGGNHRNNNVPTSVKLQNSKQSLQSGNIVCVLQADVGCNSCQLRWPSRISFAVMCLLQKNVFLQKLKCQAMTTMRAMRRKLPVFQVIKIFLLYVYTLSFYLYFIFSSICCFKIMFL